MKSYYEILGVSDNADALTIKKAYRSLVKKYHPDIYKGEDRDTKFQEIQKAYDVLSDENKRAAYDRNGHSNYENSEKFGGGRPGGFQDFGGFSDFSDFSNFGGFSTYTSSSRFSEIPFWKKLLLFVGLAILAIVVIVGFIIVNIVKLIIGIINEIFK